jgi:dTDP-glucose pyrophosphorylase
MLNILIPLAGPTPFFDSSEYPFPKPLIEIRGKPMVEHVITNLKTIEAEKRFIFLLRDHDCSRFHLDETVRLLAGEDAVILKIKGETKGSVCSVLLAVDFIDNNETLLISNGDQLFEHGISERVLALSRDDIDGGCLVFESVHPRWSYVRIEGDRKIVEASEKRPISKNAIAGIYVFRRGSDFVKGAKEAIRKDANVGGAYYVSAVLNELVLMNRSFCAVPVPNEDYVTFYSPQKIAEYEAAVRLWK